MLGSLDATLRQDAQLAGCQLRHWAEDKGARAGCAVAGVPPLEAAFFEDKALADRLLPPWPLLRACRGAGVPAAALLAFVSEGDNVADAVLLADAARGAVPGLAPAVGGAAAQWRQPVSWQAAMFGARPQAAF